MSEELKKIWDEIADETGWIAAKEEAAAAEAAKVAVRKTARETAKLLLNYGDPIEKIAEVTKLSTEEVTALANTPVVT